MRNLIAFVLLMFVVTSHAAENKHDIVEKLEQGAAAMQQRLNLTDAQQEKMDVILEDSYRKQQAVLEKHGIAANNAQKREKLGLRKARQLGKDMADVRKDTRAAASEVLSEAQLAEFDKIQDERKAERRARLRERR